MHADQGVRLKRLAPLPAKGPNASQAGLEPEVPPHIARGIAFGYLHPSTHVRFPGTPAGGPQQVWVMVWEASAHVVQGCI